MTDMTPSIAVKQQAIKLFGASEAAGALLALDYLLDACSVQKIEDAIGAFAEPRFEQIKIQTLVLMSESGFEEQENYAQYLDTWQHYVQDEIVNKPVVERTGYEPVNLGTAFHQGKLYYPIQTLIRTTVYSKGGRRQEAERIDIAVVRSDRTLLHLDESTDENGRKSGIYRLTDNTLLQKKPTGSMHASWSWASVQQYLGGKYPSRTLMMLAARVHRHLYSSVWLPNENDYWLLTFAAITSYCQAVFEAVPLILLHGERGTGKSELGAAMSNLSCNAVMIGKTSPETMIRLMDEARGLVVIDDLESVGAKAGGGGKERFSEMVQVLKMSYKKSSATKVITNSRRVTEVMNFYGVKIISNTTGVDAILGSRMLHVSTQGMPKTEIDTFLARQGLSASELDQLRNDLHVWCFENVDAIHKAYIKMVSGSSQRDEEIAAPLRALASLSGITQAEEALNHALVDQGKRQRSYTSPEDALNDIICGLIHEGAREISITELSLKLRQALGLPKGSQSKGVSWLRPEWISKKIRSLGYVSASSGRKNLFGYQMRIVTIAEEKLIEHEAFSSPIRDPYRFCQGCSGCPYRQLKCEILPYRTRREGLL